MNKIKVSCAGHKWPNLKHFEGRSDIGHNSILECLTFENIFLTTITQATYFWNFNISFYYHITKKSRTHLWLAP